MSHTCDCTAQCESLASPLPCRDTETPSEDPLRCDVAEPVRLAGSWVPGAVSKACSSPAVPDITPAHGWKCVGCGGWRQQLVGAGPTPWHGSRRRVNEGCRLSPRGEEERDGEPVVSELG